jgi:fatty acid desaturase
MARPFFRYNPRDALPALSGVGIVALIFWTFGHYHTMSAWMLVLTFAAVAYSYLWNLQCISHNFIHNPYFTNVWLNRAFSVLETFAIGVPHILYHHYHMNHHFGDNDKKGPDGKTKDWSSIYRYGKNDQPEGFWSYCIIGFFRAEVGPVVRKVLLHGPEQTAQLIVESSVLALFWIGMAILDWRYFLCFYLPSYYLGWAMSYAEGYLEHYGCQPGNHFANSVSSYNRLYNLLWFNNGYHQEHHWDPKRHWTKMKGLHEEIKPHLVRNHTRTLKGPHLTGFVEDWLTGGKTYQEPNPDHQAAA